MLKNWFLNNSLNLNEKIASEFESVKQKMDNLVSMVSSVKKSHVVQPVFKWGQSEKNILILVKFSHKFDAPGCLDIKEGKLTWEKNLMRFVVNCMQANQPLEFRLELLLDEDLHHSKATWVKDSVGTAIITIPKDSNGDIIKTLLHKDFKKPGNMKVMIWWELKGQHKSAMAEYERLIDEDDDDDWGL